VSRGGAFLFSLCTYNEFMDSNLVLDTVQRCAELLNSLLEKPVVRIARLNTIGLWIIPAKSGTPVYIPGTDDTRRPQDSQGVIASFEGTPDEFSVSMLHLCLGQ
jgi:hypothetical protein